MFKDLNLFFEIKVIDNRVAKHAKILVEYSTKVKEGDNVLILMQDYGFGFEFSKIKLKENNLNIFI
ncbi:MAG: hypothetical protein ACP5H3_01940 [Candidatus Aenigmatarchaeota archaeon]